MRRHLTVLLTLLLSAVVLSADSPSDSSFGFNGAVCALNLQVDGKVLVAGNFSTFSGRPVGSGLARLNADGTLDDGFTSNVISVFDQAEFRTLLFRPDGSIYVGGACRINGQTAKYGLMRFLSDGKLDHSFALAALESCPAYVNSIAGEPDGTLLVGTSGRTFQGKPFPGLVRIAASGRRDTAFAAEVGEGVNIRSSVKSIVINGEGKAIVVGDFRSFNGHKVDGIVRLNVDGSMDVEFLKLARQGYFVGFQRVNPDDEEADTGLFLSDVVLQPDGKIIVSGEFVLYDEAQVVSNTRLIRLDGVGMLDRDFVKNAMVMNFADDINSLLLQPDGQVVVGCDKPFERLLSDGTADMDFHRLAAFGFHGSLNSMVYQSDDKIIIGGSFSSYKGIKARNIVRINPDGTMDETFSGVGR